MAEWQNGRMAEWQNGRMNNECKETPIFVIQIKIVTVVTAGRIQLILMTQSLYTGKKKCDL